MSGAYTLGMASAVDYSLQFLSPLILVRVLSIDDFANYRAFWLVANTAYAFATIGMPFSLFYFLARKKGSEIYLISNVILFLFITGVISILSYILLQPILPENIKLLKINLWLVASFIVLMIVGSLLDVLPNAENRISVQAKLLIIMAIARFLAVSGIAILTKSFAYVALSLTMYAIFKCGTLIITIVKNYKTYPFKPRFHLLIEQMKYALPFGFAGVLYNFREQGDQWIAAAKFTLEDFACFTLAGVASPVIGIIRQSVSNAILPSMNENQYKGNIQEALKLNRHSNLLAASVLVPVLSFLYFYAEDLMTIVYTEKYTKAYLPLQIYLLGLASQLFIANNLMVSMAKGSAMFLINIICLPVSLIISIIGASWFGILGAALGSAVTQWAGNLAGLLYTKNILNVKMNMLIDIKKILLYLFVLSSITALIKYGLETQLQLNMILKITIGALPLMILGIYTSWNVLKNEKL